MAVPISAPLNAEPADPEERRDNNLPEKSYADAVQEEAPVDGAHENSGSNAANGSSTTESNGANGAGEEKHKVGILRIIDTGAPAAPQDKPEKGEKPEERPTAERQVSQREYTATVRTERSGAIWTI